MLLWGLTSPQVAKLCRSAMEELDAIGIGRPRVALGDAPECRRECRGLVGGGVDAGVSVRMRRTPTDPVSGSPFDRAGQRKSRRSSLISDRRLINFQDERYYSELIAWSAVVKSHPQGASAASQVPSMDNPSAVSPMVKLAGMLRR